MFRRQTARAVSNLPFAYVGQEVALAFASLVITQQTAICSRTFLESPVMLTRGKSCSKSSSVTCRTPGSRRHPVYMEGITFHSDQQQTYMAGPGLMGSSKRYRRHKRLVQKLCTCVHVLRGFSLRLVQVELQPQSECFFK